MYAALRAGASGFLLKDTPTADLLSGIRVAARGDAIVAPSVTRRLIERHIGTSGDLLPRTEAELRVLTEREREVLELVARGLSNAEIAGRRWANTPCHLRLASSPSWRSSEAAEYTTEDVSARTPRQLYQRLSPDQRAALAEEFSSGVIQRDLVARYGISVRSVKRLVRAARDNWISATPPRTDWHPPS